LKWIPDKAFEKDLADIRRNLHFATREVRDDIRASLSGIGDIVVSSLMANTPRDEDSPGPHLADQWTAQTAIRGNAGVTLRVGNEDPRANQPLPQLTGQSRLTLLEALEFGTRPGYIILPRRAPALTFFWKRMGMWVTLRRVGGPPRVTPEGIPSHPGVRPHGMIAKAVAEGQKNLRDIAEALHNYDYWRRRRR